ncbi:hypothetical protein IUD25_05945 [Xylella fastidiosa subsp. fastidiosa]|uniref:hypothetical protein n=1 Tax=Xylella fastidiosa TaxID=2371 RepID=UPI001396B7F5|nr:hypothetical protein [Xylella fastidiosa]MBE0265374.1 hypothetical protein [Xylella fastidiosa subsp. fastidiosa]MBE0271941.1 hypothetical protein [Xylella fastidiosa subsp. fastidiosa]MBE0274047.1 hypothetical protein [Xylella fastidiosa subsp. fastidiosa]MBE0287308.1 hypothetical protein [Xylella fastidiosa subsp. fastidiosa]MBE7610426.1 hypothetical protein [Xylella fastidiosa subsp. fastidiosa]
MQFSVVGVHAQQHSTTVLEAAGVVGDWANRVQVAPEFFEEEVAAKRVDWVYCSKSFRPFPI